VTRVREQSRSVRQWFEMTPLNPGDRALGRDVSKLVVRGGVDLCPAVFAAGRGEFGPCTFGAAGADTDELLDPLGSLPVWLEVFVFRCSVKAGAATGGAETVPRSG
jgi:hypothetical protein